MQEVGQPIAAERLRHILVGPHPQPALALVEHADHDDRNLGRPGVTLERREHAPAVEARHDHVEDDRRGMQLLGHPQALLAGVSGPSPEAFLVQVALHQLADRGVVVDDQDEVGVSIAGTGRGPRHGSALGTEAQGPVPVDPSGSERPWTRRDGRSNLRGQSHSKRRAPPFFALDDDLPPHGLAVDQADR